MHTPLPWMLEQQDVWPFTIVIRAEDGKIVLSFDRVAISTRQETLQDCLDAKGFSPEERSAVIEQLSNQVETIALIVRAVNCHQELVEALTACLKHPGFERCGHDCPTWAKATEALAKATE